MAESEKLGASFNIDVSNLKAGLTQANRLIKESESEFKAAAAGMDDWRKSEEGLTAKKKQLTDTLTVQNKVLDAYKQQLKESGYAEDDMSAAAVELRTKINNQEAAVKKTEKALAENEQALDDVRKAMEEAGDAADEAGDSLEEAGNDAKDAGDGFTIAKGAVADLISNGLTALVGACKNAISSIAGLADETREFRQDIGTLETAFSEAGFTAEQSTDTWKKLYGIFGEDDRAVEAANNISRMSKSQQDLNKWVAITTGIWSTYQDALPVEGLAESAGETAKVGKITGVMADALNWSSEAAKMFAGYMSDDVTSAEDAFNVALSECNNEAERQALITETLTKLYGSANDTYRENNGALIEANEAQADYLLTLGDLGDKIEPVTTKVKEGFGQILEKILELTEGVDLENFATQVSEAFEMFANDVMPVVVDGLQWFVDNKDGILAAFSGIAAAFAVIKLGALVAKVMEFISFIQGAGGILAALKIGIAALGGPVTLIIAAVAGLVTAFVVLWKKCDWFRNFWIGLWEGIKNAAKAVGEWFKTTWGQIVDWFAGLWEGIKNAASIAWEGIKAVFSTVIGWYYDHIVSPIINSPLFKIITELAQGCWEAIKIIWSVVKEWVNTNVILPVQNFFSAMWSNIKQFASNAWNGIKGVWNAVSGWFNATVIAPLKNAFSNAWNALKNGALEAWTGIKNIFSPVAQWFGDIFSKAWSKVKAVFSTGGKVFSGIKEGIEKAFKTIVNALIRGVNKVVSVPFNAINNMLDKIRNVEIMGLSPFKNLITRFNVPSIPELAKGGVVRGATNAIIGEDGAEAVVPLERNTEWLDKVADKIAEKSGGVTINQTNNYSQAHSRYELYKSRKEIENAVRFAKVGV